MPLLKGRGAAWWAATLPAVALAILAGCKEVRAQCLPTYEGYDEGLVSSVAAPITVLSCNGVADGSAVEVVQLFTPVTVPWQYTMVCVNAKFDSTVLDKKQTIVVSLYDDVNGIPAAKARASETYVAASTPSSQTSWINIATSTLIATSRRVFIGFTLSSPCVQSYYSVTKLRKTRLSFWRKANATTWTRHMADWTHDNITAVAVRAKGSALSTVPASWTCTASEYSDSLCSCGCGAWDPACAANRSGPVSANCSAGQVCNRLGSCVSPGWDTSKCALGSFGGYDGCQCGCGGTVVDPDCKDSTEAGGPWRPRATNCGSGYNVAMCNDAGACAEAWPNCSNTSYGDGAFCDCSCQANGVLDPDCSLSSNETDCGSSGNCFEHACRPFAAHWRCALSEYNSAAYCDCNCGGFDPDCYPLTRPGIVKGCPTSTGYVCNSSALCVPAGCGNKLTEIYSEECDSGNGCANCTCMRGWGATAPRSNNCEAICGDGIVVGQEECDSGPFCTSSCTCQSGHSPLSSRQTMCSGCPSGYLDSGEECDGGAGCNRSSCQCLNGWEPTSPPSLDCKQSYLTCGDLVIQDGEQCDGGKYCNSSNCKCLSGYLPYNSPQKFCQGCGNGYLDSAEECDGGSGCTPNCTCANEFQQSTPRSTACQLITKSCGNKNIDGSEECDGGRFCNNDNCTCRQGHSPYDKPTTFCRGCGNNFLDDGEECDGGLGCSSMCSCSSGFRAYSTPALNCRENAIQNHSTSKNDNKIAVGVPIGVTGVVMIGTMGGLLGAVFYLRRKEAPSRPLDVPSHNGSFVPTTAPLPGEVEFDQISGSPVRSTGGLPYVTSLSDGSAFGMNMMASGFVAVVPTAPVNQTLVVPLDTQLGDISKNFKLAGSGSGNGSSSDGTGIVAAIVPSD